MSEKHFHHPDCDAGDHEGFCSQTNEAGESEVFLPATEDAQSYVAHGTKEFWDGREATADDPFSKHEPPTGEEKKLAE